MRIHMKEAKHLTRKTLIKGIIDFMTSREGF